MKKLLFTLFLLSACFYSEAQITFQKTYGGTGSETALCVQQTTDGGYIITGYTESFGVGNENVYLIKTDTNGNLIWTKTFGGISLHEGYSVHQTSDGGYIITGWTHGFGAGSYDVYLIRSDANGDSLWTKTFGGTADDRGHSVKQTTDGGYIIGGLTSFGAGYFDFYLIKTDSIGDSLWTKSFGGTNDDRGYSVQQTTDGGYIITGSTVSFGAGSGDAYLIKTDANGDSLWTKTFGGTAWDEGSSVQQTTDGGYIIAGITYSFGAGNYDVYLIKTDTLGSVLWTKTFGGTDDDVALSVQQTTDGGYIITGYTLSFGAGNWDAYLIKTDPNGDSLWTKTFGGSVDDRGFSVQQTTDGGYVIAGWSGGDFYLIKTDSLGNSGCNEGSTATIVTSPPTQVINPATMVGSTSTIVTSPATIVGSGGTVTTLCTNVGINEISNFQYPISISPNPSSGIFTITFPENFFKGKIEIYSVMGEKIYNEKINGENKKEINLKKISAGIYFVKINTVEKQYTQKLIIQ